MDMSYTDSIGHMAGNISDMAYTHNIVHVVGMADMF